MGSKTSLIKFNFSNRNTVTPLPIFPSSRHSPRGCAVLLLDAPLHYQRPPAAGDSHPDWSHIAPRLRHLHSDALQTFVVVYNFTPNTEDRFHTVTVTRQHRHYKNALTGQYMLYPVQKCLLRRKYLYNSNTCTIAFLCYHRQH